MSTYALVAGLLFRPPERRLSKAGRPFVVATIKVKDGDALQWWRVTVFSESAMAELMRLSDGDALSVQGSFKAEIYAKDGGEPKISLSVIADAVLPLRAPKERKPKAPDPAPQDTRTRERRCRGEWKPGAGPSDDIPFGGEP